MRALAISCLIACLVACGGDETEFVSRTNEIREAYALPPAVTNPDLLGAQHHAEYLGNHGAGPVGNCSPAHGKIPIHCEDSRSPFYTKDGSAAAAGSIYFAGNPSFSASRAAEHLSYGFHGMTGALLPSLRTVGMGLFRGNNRSVFVYDMWSGENVPDTQIQFPIFPIDGACFTALVHDVREVPTEPADFANYKLPTGNTIVGYLGLGRKTVTASELFAVPYISDTRYPARVVEAYHLHAATPLPGQVDATTREYVSKSMRTYYNAIMVIPRQPLRDSLDASLDRDIRYVWRVRWIDEDATEYSHESIFRAGNCR